MKMKKNLAHLYSFGDFDSSMNEKKKLAESRRLNQRLRQIGMRQEPDLKGIPLANKPPNKVLLLPLLHLICFQDSFKKTGTLS